MSRRRAVRPESGSIGRRPTAGRLIRSAVRRVLGGTAEGATVRRGAARDRGAAAEAAEVLEDRTLLAAFLVNNLGDFDDNLNNGTTTLREAIRLSNDTAGADTISFASGLSNSTITRTLALGQYTILDDVTITGLGSNQLTIDSNGTGRLFAVATGLTVNLSGMTLANADARLNITAGGGGVVPDNGEGGALFTQGAMTISDIAFDGNTGVNGGAIFVDGGSLTIQGDAVFTGNVATGTATDEGGGGIYVDAGTSLTIRDNLGAVRFGGLNGQNGPTIAPGDDANVARNGGAIFSAGTLTIEDNAGANVTFLQNLANRAGGAIEIFDGTASLEGIVLEENRANVNGGGLHITDGSVSLFDGVFDSVLVTDNEAGQEGGGLWNSSIGTLFISGGASGNGFNGVVISGNEAEGNAAAGINNVDLQGGGGIFNDGGQLALSDGVTVTGNVASGTVRGSGGGILSIAGTVSLDEVSISNNVAVRAGGGIEIVAGDVTIFDDGTDGVTGRGDSAGRSLLFNNTAGANPGNGGGLHVSNVATVDLSDLNVTDNTAANEGGGLWNSANGTMTLTRVIVDDNVASIGDGGGVFNNGGVLSILDSTLSNNDAGGSGGGVAQLVGGTLAIVNSTLSGNTADDFGGGLYAAAGFVVIENSTIEANNALTGDGIAQTGATVDLENTIVSHSAGGGIEDVSGSINADFSLIQNVGGAAIVGANNVLNLDPRLNPLADNGGPTLTHSLRNGSPAIDAGSNGLTNVSSDQRGFPRFLGAAVDIGAFESDPNTTATDTSVVFIGTLADRDAEAPGAILITPTPNQNLTVNLSNNLLYPDPVTSIILDDSAASLRSLTILGDDDSDVTVFITAGADAGIFTFAGTSANESVEIDGIVDSVSFNGGLGNDSLTANAGATLNGSVSFVGGGGNDIATLSDVNVDGGLTLNGGADADTFVVTNVDVAGKAVLDLGDGDDSLTVDTLDASRIVALGRAGTDVMDFTDLSSGSAGVSIGGDGFGLSQVGIGQGDDVILVAQTLPGRMIQGTLAVDAGNGNDTVDITDVDAGRVIALGRFDSDLFNFTNVAASRGVEVQGGSGDDTLFFDGGSAGVRTITGKLIVDLDSGNDTAVISDTVADRIVVLGRDGIETLTLTDLAADSGVSVQTGSGDDVLDFDGNSAGVRTITGKLVVDVGSGNDSATVVDTYADRIVVLGRDGDDTLTLTDLAADAGLTVQAGLGLDTLMLDAGSAGVETITGKLIVDLGGGDDMATLVDVFADRVIVLGRDGDDLLDLSDTMATGGMIVYAGAGADQIDIGAGVEAADYCIGVENDCTLDGSGVVPPGTYLG